MDERALKHRRLHHLLLLDRLLSLRETASPFTLILDSLEQSGIPLLKEYIQHAKSAKATVVFISFETPEPPPRIDIFIKARRKDTATLRKEISQATSGSQKCLFVLDTLNYLASTPSLDLPNFLSSLLTPSTSLLALYHHDIPLPPAPSPYCPCPLTLLKYLATTIFTVHSLAQVLARKRAAEKSLAEGVFGLAEEIEGILVGRGSNDPRGVVLEMEHRRKSGREVQEWFFLPAFANSGPTVDRAREKTILLDDHPLYRPAPPVDQNGGQEGVDDGTFSLGLTEKQRRDREGVVLPYFDAQREGGGVGGRILYDMGVEDDFDEEEDEI